MSTPHRFGAVAATIYLVVAIYVVFEDRRHPLLLANTATFLLTAPISTPLAWLGVKVDLTNIWIVSLFVLATAALFYRVAWGLAGLRRAGRNQTESEFISLGTGDEYGLDDQVSSSDVTELATALEAPVLSADLASLAGPYDPPALPGQVDLPTPSDPITIAASQKPFSVLMVGGGMIAHDQILPSLYQLQRLGRVGDITVCAQRASTLAALAKNETIRKAFPGYSFRPVKDPGPDAFRQAIAALPPRQLVIVAVPDQLHFDVVMTALFSNQNVISVKPLVLTVAEALEIEREARQRQLFVGVEYHKRFDDRSLLARRRYRHGLFGEFKLGTARLMEKWYYRNSNFQNWFTTDNSDSFTYIGCHYIDFVHFVTGLLPSAVSVYGIKDRFPNGNEGYLWTDARVIWSNGACLNVQNSLSFPDDAPGSNTQGITMYFSDGKKGAWLDHSDQYRGIKHCYTERLQGDGTTVYSEPSTEYFQYVDLGGPCLQPVGYGYRSIEFLVQEAARLEAAEDRAATLAQIDMEGIVATPANSSFNEAVIEAGRLSILNDGRLVDIHNDSVRFRE
jgi:D-galacturonate reductase